MGALLYLLVVAGIMHAVRGFAPSGATPGAGAALTLGYLLLSAYFAGKLFAALKLPRLTGYLACGLVAGPHGLGYLQAQDIADLRVFTSIAVALIALGAGAELSVRDMRSLVRAISSIATFAIACSVVVLTAVILGLRPWLPFVAALPWAGAAAMAAVVAIVLSAQSPAVALALRSELDADGPVTRTVLGLVVVGDVAIIVLFSCVATLTKAVLGGSADVGLVAQHLSWQLFGSVGAGLLIGAVLSGFLRVAARGVPLFVAATCLVLGEVATALELEPVLVGLTAGALVRNLSRQAEALHEAIRESQLPVYVVFFSVAGASIHLDTLAQVALPAVALVLARALGLLAGARFGARLARAPESVQRFSGYGLLPQAGLALALAMSFKATFADSGEEAAALVLGVVAINEMLAPALYRNALVRAGEVTDPAPREAETGGVVRVPG